MTDIVPIPTPPTVPPYPALGSSNFNSEAYAYGSSMPAVVAAILVMNQAGYTNGVAAQERATAAGNSAITAGEQATAAAQAKAGAESARDTASGHSTAAGAARQGAEAARDTATTAAGTATSARQGADAARDTAVAQAGLATTARQGAEAARDAAAVYASSQIRGSSTTSVAPSAGVKTLTIEANRSFVVGMYVVATSTSDPGTWMSGYVKSYGQSTGVLEITVDAFKGSAARADWVIGVAAPGAAGGLALQVVTANTTCVAGVAYIVAAAGITLTLPTSWTAGDSIQWIEAIQANARYSVAFGATPLRGRSLGTQVITSRRGATPVLRYQDSTRGLV